MSGLLLTRDQDVLKLGGETDSEIRRKKQTDVTSPKGSEEASCADFFLNLP